MPVDGDVITRQRVERWWSLIKALRDADRLWVWFCNSSGLSPDNAAPWSPASCDPAPCPTPSPDLETRGLSAPEWRAFGQTLVPPEESDAGHLSDIERLQGIYAGLIQNAAQNGKFGNMDRTLLLLEASKIVDKLYDESHEMHEQLQRIRPCNIDRIPQFRLGPHPRHPILGPDGKEKGFCWVECPDLFSCLKAYDVAVDKVADRCDSKAVRTNDPRCDKSRNLASAVPGSITNGDGVIIADPRRKAYRLLGINQEYLPQDRKGYLWRALSTLHRKRKRETRADGGWVQLYPKYPKRTQPSTEEWASKKRLYDGQRRTLERMRDWIKEQGFDPDAFLQNDAVDAKGWRLRHPLRIAPSKIKAGA